MKTKKLNRGLLLGGVLIVGLAGYIVFDRVSFKSNKTDIENAVRDYLTGMANENVGLDESKKEEFKKLIDDSWGYNRFFEDNFLFNYTTASDIKENIDNLKEDGFKNGTITECRVDIDEIKVSKAGPNLAQAEVSYVVTFKGKGDAALVWSNYVYGSITDSFNVESSEGFNFDKNREKLKDIEYTGKMEYNDENVLYLELEGGKWKIVGEDGYHDSFNLYDENGGEINIDRIINGENESDKEDDNAADDDSSSQGGDSGDAQAPDSKTDDSSQAGESISDAQDMPEAQIKTGDDKMPAPDESKAGGEADA